jgi:hypothetical protein
MNVDFKTTFHGNLMMKHVIPALAVAAVMFMGSPPVNAGILFDNGPAVDPAVDYLLLNSDPFVVYDNFTLTSAAIVDGVVWTERDHTTDGHYLGTDISILNDLHSLTTTILSESTLATRSANGSLVPPGSHGETYSVTNLHLSLPAGTYFLGIHNNFDDGSQSTWDQSIGSDPALSGRYQFVPPQNVPPGADRLQFIAGQDSVFQVLGTPQADPGSSPVPEPSTLVASSILLGFFGARRAGNHWRRNSQKPREG